MNQFTELTNDDLKFKAPSIFQSRPIDKASNRYSFVPTIQAIDYLRDAGWKPVDAGQARVNKDHRNGFQKHLVRFSRPDLIINDSRADLLLYNSHDLGSSFKLIAGVFRFVCANGMVVGDTMASFSHKHIGFNPNQFIESAQAMNAQTEQIAGVIEDWQTIDLEEVEKNVFAQAAHQIIYPEQDQAPISPDQLLTPRRYADKSDNLWTTFNVVQENVLKGGLRGRKSNGKRMKTRAVKSIDRNRALNQALWTLTEKMAELKAA